MAGMLTIVFLAFAMIMGYIVLQVISQIISQRKCLEDETIMEYKKGRLPSDERRTVHYHLGICEKCQNRMIDYDGDDIERHLLEE